MGASSTLVPILSPVVRSVSILLLLSRKCGTPVRRTVIQLDVKSAAFDVINVDRLRLTSSGIDQNGLTRRRFVSVIGLPYKTLPRPTAISDARLA